MRQGEVMLRPGGGVFLAAIFKCTIVLFSFLQMLVAGHVAGCLAVSSIFRENWKLQEARQGLREARRGHAKTMFLP